MTAVSSQLHQRTNFGFPGLEEALSTTKLELGLKIRTLLKGAVVMPGVVRLLPVTKATKLPGS
jgi:hypothetical protein